MNNNFCERWRATRHWKNLCVSHNIIRSTNQGDGRDT